MCCNLAKLYPNFAKILVQLYGGKNKNINFVIKKRIEDNRSDIMKLESAGFDKIESFRKIK